MVVFLAVFLAYEFTNMVTYGQNLGFQATWAFGEGFFCHGMNYKVIELRFTEQMLNQVSDSGMCLKINFSFSGIFLSELLNSLGD